MMNRMERPPGGDVEAVVEYGHGEFRVLRFGGFVRCAVTAAPIPLESLRYWNVARQEAYAAPEAVLTRVKQTGR